MTKATKSQTMRRVIYLLWEKKGRPTNEEEFYNKVMDKLIENLKQLL